MRWPFPGPAAIALWLLTTVVSPLVSYDLTHLWEESQDATPAAMWAVGSSPLVALVTAAGAARRPGARLVAAMPGATVSGWVLLAVALVGWQWIIPLDGALDPFAVAVPGAGLCVVGAALGYGLGATLPQRSDRRATVSGYVAGAIVVVLGALLAPVVLRYGAEDSTVGYGQDGRYRRDGVVVLPAAGRYAIMASDGSPRRDCRLTGGGVTGRRAEAVTVPPADYPGGGGTIAWVATITAPAPGTYELTCGDDDTFSVADVPEIRGAVGSMIHWPLVVILLLGAAPGLAIVADTVRRRRTAPQPTQRG